MQGKSPLWRGLAHDFDFFDQGGMVRDRPRQGQAQIAIVVILRTGVVAHLIDAGRLGQIGERFPCAAVG